MARPRKNDPAQRLSATAAFAASRGEVAALATAAQARGLSLSAYLREIVFAAAHGPAGAAPAAPAASAREAQLARVAAVRELSRVGNNLNQLVRLYHAGRDVPARVEAVLPTLQSAIMGIVAHDAE